MFGWSLIRTKELDELQMQNNRVREAYRWFSGWRDLDIIWKYIIEGNTYINSVRERYAFERKTDVYGKPKGASDE
jgi:hypothetical protein